MTPALRRHLDHLRSDDGIALVVAMLLMAIMLSMGLAILKLSDGQSALTSSQRQRETSFNIAEAALNAQVTQISNHWVGVNGVNSSLEFKPCPGGSYCPTGSELTSLTPSADTAVTPQWQTRVYDNSNGLETYFSDTKAGTQCGCDANTDGKVWVRAEATVRGHRRVVVSLVQEQTQQESAPHAAIIAGGFAIGNNGNKTIIDANGGIVGVRCQVPTDGSAESSSNPCLGQPLGVGSTKTTSSWTNLLTTQINGFASAQQNYSPAPVFTQDQIDRFITTAQSEGTYYTSCPSTLAGQVVVINTTGSCSYSGNSQWNTQASPGFLIMLSSASTLALGGTTAYYGVIYHANMGQPPTLGSSPQSSGPLISTQGNTLITGGLIIDGPGRFDAGESGLNIKFDDSAYRAVRSLAGAGIIQNSWREITPGQ